MKRKKNIRKNLNKKENMKRKSMRTIPTNRKV